MHGGFDHALQFFRDISAEISAATRDENIRIASLCGRIEPHARGFMMMRTDNR
jgi:hypothetical protein